MSSSLRGPQAGGGAAYVLHLERVCQLIEMGQRFTIEFRPTADLPLNGLVRDVGLRILEDGEVEMATHDGGATLRLGLYLYNYKRLWRCWRGEPSEAQRRAMRWG